MRHDFSHIVIHLFIFFVLLLLYTTKNYILNIATILNYTFLKGSHSVCLVYGRQSSFPSLPECGSLAARTARQIRLRACRTQRFGSSSDAVVDKPWLSVIAVRRLLTNVPLATHFHKPALTKIWKTGEWGTGGSWLLFVCLFVRVQDRMLQDCLPDWHKIEGKGPSVFSLNRSQFQVLL